MVAQGGVCIADQIAAVAETDGLEVGDQLPSIRSLSSRFGVTTSAVREAMQELQHRGLVKVLPRAGAFLQSPESRESTARSTDETAADPIPGEYNLFHLLDARRVIELELAGRAAERRRLEDLEPIRRTLRRTLEEMAALPAAERRENYVELDLRFHRQLAGLAGNDVLADLHGSLLDRLRPHLERIPWDTERHAETDASHAAIYTALAEGNRGAIQAELRAHLQSAYDGLLREMTHPPIPASDRKTAATCEQGA